jgi:hypothetical protein
MLYAVGQLDRRLFDSASGSCHIEAGWAFVCLGSSRYIPYIARDLSTIGHASNLQLGKPRLIG